MQKIKERIKKFFRWIWGECKDYRTLLLLFGVMAVVYAPVWVGYLLYAIFRWRWCFAMATGCLIFWAGPFTPFFPICIAITLAIKKLLEKKRKKEADSPVENGDKNDENLLQK